MVRIYSVFVAAIAMTIVLYVLLVYISNGLFVSLTANKEREESAAFTLTSTEAIADDDIKCCDEIFEKSAIERDGTI